MEGRYPVSVLTVHGYSSALNVRPHAYQHLEIGYLIGPFSAGPFLTPAPLTPALIPPVLKMRLTPFRAGVKRATNFSKSGVKRAAFLEGQCKKVHPKKLIAPPN